MTSVLVKVATCSLNQWALDFDGNLTRTRESIRRAKADGAKLRLGPELELPGYGCEDHFLEADTFHHSWNSLASLLSDDTTDGILVAVGMPVLHAGVRYNTNVWICNRRVILIRPKMYLADNGNYRETRYFTAWAEVKIGTLEEHRLPPAVVTATGGQHTAPFGVGIVQCRDGSVASEICEEVFVPRSPHISMGMQGVDIIANASGSHHQLRKLNQRVDLINGATAKSGGVYLYANQQGCDGGRLYFDGCAMISLNGRVVAQGSQFSVRDVELVAATVDLVDVRSMRSAIPSRGLQAQTEVRIPRVDMDFWLAGDPHQLIPTLPREPAYHSAVEEIAFGPACWLWDYLRRSGANGFMLPLSGGADSSATAALVGVMCHLVCAELARGNQQVLADVRRVTGEPIAPSLGADQSLTDLGAAAGGGGNIPRARLDDGGYVPTSPRELASRLFHTAYLGTENSSQATRKRAQLLADQLGAYHYNVRIDTMVRAVLTVFKMVTGRVPMFGSEGGSWAEDLALQNIQARLRMVFTYLLAQLVPWVRGKRGWLLVLGSANVDEGLRGYMTKYDCSSADINPIGGICKSDLKQFLVWAADAFGWSALADVVAAPPTAELRPIGGAASVRRAFDLDTPDDTDASSSGVIPADLEHSSDELEAAAAAAAAEHSQTDEDDMGMTYDELGWFGRLRKLARCGPFSMYEKLVYEWHPRGLPPAVVGEKVKRFFRFYAINRHKMTVVTPAYHAEQYSPDDNRFDLRPFLYPVNWTAQFRAIDEDVARREQCRAVTSPSVQAAAATGSSAGVAPVCGRIEAMGISTAVDACGISLPNSPMPGRRPGSESTMPDPLLAPHIPV